MGITPRSFRHPIRSMVRESIVSALAMLVWKNRDRIIGQARSMMGSKQKNDMSRPIGDRFVPTVAGKGIHDIADEVKAE